MKKEKRSWYKLYDHKCPVIGCLTNGRKTRLIKNGNIWKCPKCGGSWRLTSYAPMDICWVEIKKPKEGSI